MSSPFRRACWAARMLIDQPEAQRASDIASHPLAGVGPGHALRWTSLGGAVSVDQYAHDEYLQVFTDLGIIGAALVCCAR